MALRKPWIVCAAIMFEDVIITGPRHYCPTMNAQLDNSSQTIKDLHRYRRKSGGVYQGFVDQFGKFYNRKDAMKIVIASGQPFDLERNGGDPLTLYSEGIY